MAVGLTPEEIKRRGIEAREKALASFPFERMDVAGQDALSTWEKLKAAGRGVPVVIGDDESFEHLLGPFSPNYPLQRPLAAVLSAAEGIRHPESLAAHKAEEIAKARDFLKRRFESEPNAPIPKM